MRSAFGSGRAPALPVVDLSRTTLATRVEVLQRELDELRGQSETDHLTGLGNRRMFDRRASGRWTVLCDLDGFKRAQDHHPRGHDYGDQVLREFAAFLRRATRRDDALVARNGGDEFAIGVTGREAALALRDRIRSWRSMDQMVTVSVGIGADLQAADAAMYLSKQGKR